MTGEDQIEELRRRIKDLKARLPAHSIPPSMMAELDDLEEQLEEALRQQVKGSDSLANN